MNAFGRFGSTERQYSSVPHQAWYSPELRYKLQERQQKLRKKEGNKQKEWATWEKDVEEEENEIRKRRTRSSQRPSLFSERRQMVLAQRGKEASERLAASNDERRFREQQLDDVRKNIKEKIKERQRRSRSWLGVDVKELQPSLGRGSMVQSRNEARRQKAFEYRQEQHPLKSSIRDSDYVRNRMMQKVSSFSSMVDAIQGSQYARQEEKRPRRGYNGPGRGDSRSKDENKETPSYGVFNDDVRRVQRGNEAVNSPLETQNKMRSKNKPSSLKQTKAGATGPPPLEKAEISWSRSVSNIDLDW